jgi:hypothetical protein
MFRRAFKSFESGFAVRLILLIGFMVVNGLTNVHAQAKQDVPGADLIVHNAKIFTGNPAQREASAPAVNSRRVFRSQSTLASGMRSSSAGRAHARTHGTESFRKFLVGYPSCRMVALTRLPSLMYSWDSVADLATQSCIS